MAQQLERLRIRRISLVDEPASQDPTSDFGAFVTLYKAADMDEKPEGMTCGKCGAQAAKGATECPKCGAPMSPADEPAKEKQMDELKAKLAKTEADLKAAEELATEEQKKREAAEADLAKAKLDLTKARMTPEAAEKQIQKLEAELKVSRMSPEERKKAERAELPETVRKQLEESEETIQKLSDERDDAMFLKRAEGLKLAGVSPAKFAPVLKRLAKNQATPADIEDLERLLKAQGEQIKTGRLFSEFGKGGFESGEPSAQHRVMAKAKELQKADPKLSVADAITQVLKADESLNSDYLAESRGQA
jgi:hypothetical protein